MVKVLIADDSRVIRTRVAAWIDAEPDLSVCGQAETGRKAVELFGRLRPDVVILDVEMPELDGLGALREIRAIAPSVPVIMFSALTETGSRMAVAAMVAGASDSVAKPLSFRVEDETRRTLLGHIRRLIAAPVVQTGPVMPRGTNSVTSTHECPDVLAIAASTGGPAALAEFFAALGPIKIPTVVVQHMAMSFLDLLVEQLGELVDLDIGVAVDGEQLQGGSIRFAPATAHLEVMRRGSHLAVGLLDTPPVNSCRPSADVLFGSIARSARTPIGVVLSGIGVDGAEGAARIAVMGGLVLAQDRKSSTVWGMPGAVVERGIARLVGSPSRLGARVRALAAMSPASRGAVTRDDHAKPLTQTPIDGVLRGDGFTSWTETLRGSTQCP